MAQPPDTIFRGHRQALYPHANPYVSRVEPAFAKNGHALPRLALR